MTEQEARVVLLVRAVEESDPRGELLSWEDRLRATRSAAASHPVESKWAPKEQERHALSKVEEAHVRARSKVLLEKLERDYPGVSRVKSRSGWNATGAALVLFGAFIFGVAANKIGPENRIHILAFPILGLLVWNVAVYVVILIRGAISSRRRGGGSAGPILRAAFHWLGAGRVFSGERLTTESVAGKESWPGKLQGSLKRFVNDWLELGWPLHLARVQTVMHLAAVLAVLGTLTGMYVRGLALEYRAGWESTFLDANAVRELLEIVLGPASTLTGIALPSTAELARLNWGAGEADEPAGRWIHLYAATAGLFIVLPRSFLALIAFLQVLRFRGWFPLPDSSDPYFRRVLGAGHGRAASVAVIPYSFAPGERERERLRSMLVELFGYAIEIHFEEPVPYGGEEEFLEDMARGEVLEGDNLVLVFNMASTPEEEVHGKFLDGIRDLMRSGRGGRQLLLILDRTRYRRRFVEAEPIGAARVAEREKAWVRLAEAHGLELAVLNLEEMEAGQNIEPVRRAIWSGREPDRAL